MPLEDAVGCGEARACLTGTCRKRGLDPPVVSSFGGCVTPDLSIWVGLLHFLP